MDLESVALSYGAECLQPCIVICRSQCLEKLLIWRRDAFVEFVSGCP